VWVAWVEKSLGILPPVPVPPRPETKIILPGGDGSRNWHLPGDSRDFRNSITLQTRVPGDESEGRYANVKGRF
jgi:hypothetical protein